MATKKPQGTKVNLKISPSAQKPEELRQGTEKVVADIAALLKSAEEVVRDTTKGTITWADLGDLGRLRQGLMDALEPWAQEEEERDPDDIDSVVEMAHDLLVKANGSAKSAAAEASRRAKDATAKSAKDYWTNVADSIADHGNLPGRV